MPTNESICNIWVDKPTKSWSSNSSNMSYSSTTLWSYSSVLAKHVEDTIHIDYSIARYSNSSMKQASHLRRAIPTSVTVFEYPFHLEPIVWYLRKCMELLDKQSRARKADYIPLVLNYLNEALLYCSTYNIDTQTATYRQLTNLSDNRTNLVNTAKAIVALS